MDKLAKYIKDYIYRYDKDGVTPYLSHLDFPGISQEIYKFKNIFGEMLCAFRYASSSSKQETVLFLPGMGPGHTAYMAEIALLCEKGYTVWTLDYTGTGMSDGKSIRSLSQYPIDANRLTDILLGISGNFETNCDSLPLCARDLIVIGHSLSGYAALCVLDKHPLIKRGVVISGFVHLSDCIKGFCKTEDVAEMMEFEREQSGKYFTNDVENFVKTTEDRILFIHSTGDPIIYYSSGVGYVDTMPHGANVQTITMTGRGHNPNYTSDAVSYIKETFTEYMKLCESGVLTTLPDKQEYMSAKSVRRMVSQDQDLWLKILTFIFTGK